MTDIDPFREARVALSHGRSRSSLPPLEQRVLAQLGPDESNHYYVDGVGRSEGAIHVGALIAIEAGVHAPCRIPFEVRVPMTWLSKVAATHAIALDAMYASQARIMRAEVAAWFGDAPAPCEHGTGCALYQQHIANVRRNGYGPRVVHQLVNAATTELDPSDENLLYRYARSIAVGAGRTGDKASAVFAEQLATRWLVNEADDSSSHRLDRANLLRSVAFAQLASQGPSIALSTVRAAGHELSKVESDATQEDEGLTFRVREAMFPTLETLSLCEGLWGDSSASTLSARELVKRFPFDSRAWIRLAKSLFAAGRPEAAVAALLNGADREHPKWLFCVIAARFIAIRSGVSSTNLDALMSRHHVTLDQLEIV